MTDIVERLRAQSADILNEEAADEIERLREVLWDIAGVTMSQCRNAADMAERMKAIASKALGEDSND